MGYKKPQSEHESSNLYVKRRRGILIPLIIIVVLLVALYFVSLAVARNNAERKTLLENLALMQEEERNLSIENEQLERYANGENLDEYLERFARDEMGYADPQERVYHVNPAD